MIYEKAIDLEEKIIEISRRLGMKHLDPSRIVCIRSRGSKSRRVLARCHVLPKIMQKALNTKAHYVIEVITENFEKLPKEEKTKILIHELLHIPKSFGGGFRHHKPHVNKKIVDKLYSEFQSKGD